MEHYCYLFEAKSIQTYLLATNRLKEIVGGSELVETLTADGGLLDTTLKICDSEFSASRRGGGAAFLFTKDKDARNRLAALWPLLVQRYAPDLEFVQARGEGATEKDAFERAHTGLLADRNRLTARLPQASPLAERSRRTGEPAVKREKTQKEGDKEPIDAVTKRKLIKDFRTGAELAKRFDPASSNKDWPVNLNPADAGEDDEPQEKLFPFIGDNRTIALVHADGNGLGELLRNLKVLTDDHPSRYLEIFRGFSGAVSQATQRAAQHATAEVLAPHRKDGTYPARPVVLGGDDLTILVRADLALPFTRCFLLAFAKFSRQELEARATELGIEGFPTRMTACAGIAYAKATQPFYLLHQLAEGLCKHAKEKAKDKDSRGSSPDKVPSTLALHRVTTSFLDRYQDILERELTVGTLRQTLECYSLDPAANLPDMDKLLELQRLMSQPGIARGPTRQLLGLVGRSPEQAQRHYKRWREVMGERYRDTLNQFDTLLEELGVEHPDGDLPYSDPGPDHVCRSPLGDLLTLSSVGNADVLNTQEEPAVQQPQESAA